MTNAARALSLPGRNLIAASLLALSAAACSKDATSIMTPESTPAAPSDAPSTYATILTYSNPIAGASFWIDRDWS